MSAVKKVTVIAAIFVLAAITGGGVLGWHLLSGQTFYADFVVDKVSGAIDGMGGLKLEFVESAGNPVTGVEARGIKIVRDGAVIASADSMELKVDLPSVLESPKLSSLTLRGLRADAAEVKAHLPEEFKGGDGPAAVGEIVLEDAAITTEYGAIEGLNLTVALGDGRYKADASGMFRSEDFAIEAEIASGGGVTIERLEAGVGETGITISGRITPEVELDCRLSRIDPRQMERLADGLDLSIASGLFDVIANVRTDGGLRVKGTAASDRGVIWGIDFAELNADLDYSPENISINNLTARMFGGRMSCAGSVKMPAGEPPAVSIDFTGHSIATAAASKKFEWLKIADAVVDMRGTARGPSDKLIIEAGLLSRKMKLLGVNGSDVRASVKADAFTVIDITAEGKVSGAHTKAAGRLTVGNKIGLDINVTSGPLSLGEFAYLFPQIKENRLGGIGSAAVHVGGTTAAVIADGTVSMDELTALDKYRVSDLSLAFKYAGGTLDIKDLIFDYEGLKIESGGSVKLGDSRGVLDITGAIENVDLSALTGIAPALADARLTGIASAAWALKGTADAPSVHWRVDTPKLGVKGYSADDVTLAGTYAGGVLEITEIKGMAEGAQVTAACSIDIGVGDGARETSYRASGEILGISLVRLSKMGLISADISGDIDCDFTASGKGGGLPEITLAFKDSRVIYSRIIEIANIGGSVSLKDGNLSFKDLRADIDSGDIFISGTARGIDPSNISPEAITLDMEFGIRSADIGRVSRLVRPETKGYQGLIIGSARVKGPVSAPEFSAEATLRAVRVMGLFFPRVTIEDMTVGKGAINLPKITARVGRGDINATARISISDDWFTTVKAEGVSVDIRSLTFSLDREKRRELEGALDFTFEGAGPLSDFTGRGELSLPSFKGLGFHVTDVRAPIRVQGGYFYVDDAVASAYGGELTARGSKNIERSDWLARVEAKGADMNQFLKTMLPDISGDITGSADFLLAIGGNSNRTSMLDGGGRFDLHNGEITGFEGIESVSKLLGGRPPRFELVHVPYSIDGKTLYLLPGTRIQAPEGDPVFRYITIDGSVGLEDRSFYMSCIGNVSLRALNSFVGGLQAVMTAAQNDTSDSSAMMSGFLSGAITGFSRNEFRDISLVVKGVSDDITFSDVHIAQNKKLDAKPEILKDNDKDKEKDEDRFVMTVEFPVGPGGKKDSDLKGQLSGQLLEQLLNSLMRRGR